MAADRPTAAATRGDAQWIGFVGATTSFVVWVVHRIWFPGALPPEVFGVIQYGVPLTLSAGAAELRWRTARRRETGQG